MAIEVICPGCRARFKVSDQFAGKKGPCPKCKSIIQVPALAEKVVIHEPEHSEVGARSASGQLVLKPIERKDSVVQPMVVAGYAAGALVLLLVALVLRNVENKTGVLALGAVVLAPPLAWGGYTMLRNDEELEPFVGKELVIRTALCSIGYALLWGVFAFVYGRFFGTAPAELWSIGVLAPVFVLLGGGVAYCAYDLDLGSGCFHYALYLLVTIALRLVMGLPAVGPAQEAPQSVVPAVSLIFSAFSAWM